MKRPLTEEEIESVLKIIILTPLYLEWMIELEDTGIFRNATKYYLNQFIEKLVEVESIFAKKIDNEAEQQWMESQRRLIKIYKKLMTLKDTKKIDDIIAILERSNKPTFSPLSPFPYI